jgi:hypothetical protein
VFPVLGHGEPSLDPIAIDAQARLADLGAELSGDLAINYDAQGVRCEMRSPLRRLEPEE